MVRPSMRMASAASRADGEHFIILRPIAVSESPIVVLGWTDEVRERMRQVGRRDRATAAALVRHWSIANFA